MNIYFIWRLVDSLWIEKSIEVPEDEQNDELIKLLVLLEMIMNIACCCFNLFALIAYYSIIPAVYEDIKDNIFLVVGGNKNIWDNFYNVTLSKSVLKLDVIANLEFWTTLYFLLYNMDM